MHITFFPSILGCKIGVKSLGFPINFRTKAGMTSAAESITESLRRTRQLMVQVGTGVLKLGNFFSVMIYFIDSSMEVLIYS